jgi:hypothetical protein
MHNGTNAHRYLGRSSVSLRAKSASPFGTPYWPSKDDLAHTPALALGFFGAALVTFGAIAIWESARLMSGKIPMGLTRQRVGKPSRSWIH